MRIQKARQEKEECPDVWKYNPNYDLRFPNSPKVRLPKLKPRTIKRDSIVKNLNVSIVSEKSNENINKELIRSSTVGSETKEELFENEIKRLSMIARQSIIDKTKIKEIKKEEIEQVSFSKHNKSLRFSRYLPRKNEINCITLDIPYLSTESTR